MNARERAWMGDAQAGGSKRAVIAALGSETFESQDIGHQLAKTVGDLLDAESRLPGPERKTKAGQGRRDDREGVAWVTAKAGRISQARNDLHELKDAAGPAVHQEQRHWRGPFSLGPNEM